MLYKYDKDLVIYYKIKTLNMFLFIISIILLISLSAYFGYKYGNKMSVVEYTEMEKLILIRETDAFSPDKFLDMLKDLNVNFPDIVIAQSIIETGWWNSRIFHKNNNLFGMKQARRRITTAGGTQYNHAYYNHWRESVYDYAFYQSRYLHSIDNKDKYLQYLSASYAEDTLYVKKIQDIINNERFKEFFN